MTDVIIDIDDVIYPWSERAHTIAEHAGITNGRTITRWKFNEDYGCTADELWNVLHDDNYFDYLYRGRFSPNTLNQLRRLRYTGFRVHIVTARGFGHRGDEIERITREELIKQNVPLDSLTFTKDKATVEAQFALDDGPHNYEALNAVGTACFLMDAVHNQDYFTEPGSRVDTVQEFVTTVLNLSRPTSLSAVA